MDGGAPAISAEELLAHVEGVRRLARALVRDEAEADDLTQEVLSAAMARPPREPGSSLAAWLAGVTRKLAKLRWRSRQRRARHEESAGTATAETAGAPSPEELLERAQTHQLLTALLLELDEPLRSTVLLRYVEGLSAADIARRLDVPAGTVRWRLKEGLDELRRRLDARAGGRRRWMLMLSPLGDLPPAAASSTGAAAGAASAASAVAQGALIMKGLKAVVAVVVLVLVAWLGVRALRGSKQAAAPSLAARAAAAKANARTAIAPMRQETARRDVDPTGTLRLEGQVIDDDEHPVAGATVAVSANPLRVAKSGEDGTFVVEGLISRHYRVEAKTADSYAASVETLLTATSEPVILRLRRGGTLEVTVRDGTRGVAVAGAAVELRSMVTWQAVSDENGRARLTGVGPGWPTLHVTAAGFAPSALMLHTSGDPQRAQQQIVVLQRGAAVSGRVVDERGAPVAGVRVIAEATAEPFPVLDPLKDGVMSGADGSWRFDALAAGSYRFVGLHPEHAPSTTTPIVLDGQRAVDGVELRLAAGATLRGRVVDGRGGGVAAARVRLTARGSFPWRATRELFSDGDGRFVIRGLGARQVDLAASCAAGSSDLLSIDIAAGGAAREVTLTIAIAGRLEGAVVRSDGTTVPEARVYAEPETLGALGEREAWEARGVEGVLADGGGRFEFVGLPPGRYRVRAVRPGRSDEELMMAKAVIAAVGDRDLRVPVLSDGRVRGKVVFKEGGSPELFRVEIAAVRPEPITASDGAFEVEAPGGTHDLVVSGPSFQRTRVPDIIVKENATTDLGSITVEKGRSVSGRVLDATGAPVAGAAVAGGLLLTGNGSQLNVVSEGLRVQETTSDASGRYVLRGFGEHPITLVAGREGVGRASSVRIPRGPSSVEVDLLLQPTGGVAGKVLRDGRALPQVVVIAKPRGARDSNFFVLTGEDGGFAFDMLAAGEYVLFPMLGGGNIQPKDMFVRAVTVRAGERATVDLEARYGPAAATVVVFDERGAPARFALVEIVAGASASANLEALIDGASLPTGSDVLQGFLRHAVGATGARVEGLNPGPYTMCATPIPADPTDRAAMGALRDKLPSLPQRCLTATITETTTQRVEIRMPPAK